MTDEQIKQKAEKYAEEHMVRIDSGGWEEDYDYEEQKNAYIAGAHSRDEEVKRLYNSLEHFRSIINNLRHPWISVEERLPEESEKHKGWLSDTVFVVTNQGDGTSARYDHATKTWCPAKILRGHITHWMPIIPIK